MNLKLIASLIAAAVLLVPVPVAAIHAAAFANYAWGPVLLWSTVAAGLISVAAGSGLAMSACGAGRFEALVVGVCTAFVAAPIMFFGYSSIDCSTYRDCFVY
jgi:hypothetical protein